MRKIKLKVTVTIDPPCRKEETSSFRIKEDTSCDSEAFASDGDPVELQFHLDRIQTY
jgi:hypothetical protein